MELAFRHATFDVESVQSVSVEYLRNGPFDGDGARFFFLIALNDGRSFQITPDSVIEPEGNTDIYYKDKDHSWSVLCQMSSVIHYGYCPWYAHDEVKQLSQQLGYPVQDRTEYD